MDVGHGHDDGTPVLCVINPDHCAGPSEEFRRVIGGTYCLECFSGNVAELATVHADLA
jgi:hypothetical protein